MDTSIKTTVQSMGKQTSVTLPPVNEGFYQKLREHDIQAQRNADSVNGIISRHHGDEVAAAIQHKAEARRFEGVDSDLVTEVMNPGGGATVKFFRKKDKSNKYYYLKEVNGKKVRISKDEYTNKNKMAKK